MMNIKEYRKAFDKLEPDSGMEERLLKKVVKKRRGNTSLICACGTVAAALACIALLAAPLLKLNADITAENNPGAVAEATVYTPIPITGKVVLTGSDISSERIMIMAGIGTQPGEVNISPGLSDALDDPANADALFYTAISVHFTLGQDYKYEGKTFEEWSADPTLEKYDEVYQTWYDEVYIPYDAEMRAAEERGEEYAQGWEKHDPFELFNNYWNETQPENVKAAYTEAIENVAKVKAAYNNWIASDEYRQLENNIIENEYSRLKSLGYDLAVSDRKLIGKLTKQQIKDFPVLNEYGYAIRWADKDEILNN